MHERFVEYLRKKGMTQKALSDLSCVSPSVISRFCGGQSITSDKLLRLLKVCDDLSLEWLFFGSGEMIRTGVQQVYNIGAYSGSDIHRQESTHVSGNATLVVSGDADEELRRIVREKDRVIAEKDRTISERDAMILELHRLLAGR